MGRKETAGIRFPSGRGAFYVEYRERQDMVCLAEIFVLSKYVPEKSRGRKRRGSPTVATGKLPWDQGTANPISLESPQDVFLT